MLLGTEGALRSQIKALDIFTLRIYLHEVITQRFCIPFVCGVPLPLGGSQVCEPSSRAAESQGNPLGDKGERREVIPAVTEAGSAGL